MTCKAKDREVIWVDPPPAKIVCPNCECLVPSEEVCHCGAGFDWHLDPYDGWQMTASLPGPIIKIRGRDE